MDRALVTVVGGTGFVGRYVVKLLAERGYSVRVVARNTEAALPLKTTGEVGQIVVTGGDVLKPESIQGMVQRSYGVVNLVGILFENRRQNFSALHAQGAEKLAQAAKLAGVRRFVHLSALGVDKAVTSKYARTKALGEKAVRAAFPEACILRPSVIFGPEDQFFNKFAGLAALPGVLPRIGGGKTRFAPVYVGDVAEAVVAGLEQGATLGQTYELAGPSVYSFRELLQFIAITLHRRPLMLDIPFGLARLLSHFTGLLPTPPLTHDQVALLEHDNVLSGMVPGLAELGIAPRAIEALVPAYLARFAKRDRF